MGRSAILLGIVLLIAGRAGAVVALTWTEFGLRFTNLGNAEAAATATGLATLHTSIAVTDPAAAPITSVILDSVRLRPDLQGGVLGNVSGALATSTPFRSPHTPCCSPRAQSECCCSAAGG